jgi:hypothetical protein
LEVDGQVSGDGFSRGNRPVLDEIKADEAGGPISGGFAEDHRVRHTKAAVPALGVFHQPQQGLESCEQHVTRGRVIDPRAENLTVQQAVPGPNRKSSGRLVAEGITDDRRDRLRTVDRHDSLVERGGVELLEFYGVVIWIV